MPPEENISIDLLDLKMLPAWVKESPDAKAYAHYEGETQERARPRGHDRRPPKRREQRERRPSRGERRPPDRPSFAKATAGRHREDRHRPPEKPLPDVAIRFIPQTN